MLNRTIINLGDTSQTVQFNAPATGMIQRSNPNSIFVRFQKGSPMENMVFPNNGDCPHIHQYSYLSGQYKEYEKTQGKITVVVLQILIFGDNQYLVEVLDKKYLPTEIKE